MADGRGLSVIARAPAMDGAHHCVECPALRAGCLHGMLGRSSAECRFETVTIEARAPFLLPSDSSFRLGLVRRGVLLRERPGRAERRVGVDVVGTGHAFYLDPSSASEAPVHLGYAVTRTLLCLCRDAALTDGLGESGRTAVELHELAMQALSRVERLSEARGRSDANARLAALLCVLADTLCTRGGAQTRLPDGLQQRDFARLLSILQESACSTLSLLSVRGLMHHRPTVIELLDRAALEAL